MTFSDRIRLRRADAGLNGLTVARRAPARLSRTVVLSVGVSMVLPVQGLLCAQTYVQVAELDPNHPIGSRITSAVTNAQLSRTLFGWVGDKVTYIWAPDNAPNKVFQFASDGAWNRVLLGRKDFYIHQFSQVDASTSLLGPAGVDYANDGIFDPGGLRVFVADRANGRVVAAIFDTTAKALTNPASTPSDPDLNGVSDVAYDGYVFATGDLYAVTVTGRVSYWCFYAPPGCSYGKRWAYGSVGSSTGQFSAPKGICVGHAGNASGSAYTHDFYVADGGNHRLVWLQNTSTGPTWMGAVTLPNGGVPLDCAVDNFGNVTVADSLNSRLVKYTWNLIYLDSYGTYGVGASNDNTLAHPHAVDVPFGMKGGPIQGWAWFGDGRVITAEDWSDQSGAREHYFGINGWVTAQPTITAQPIPAPYLAQFSYFITDHGSQKVTVLDNIGTPVRVLVNDALAPPGARTVSWNGNTDQGTLVTTGYYSFSVAATSAYGCSGQTWCTKGLGTVSFYYTGAPAVSVDGPNTVVEYTSNTWTATVSGRSPFTYQWTVDGAAAGTGTSVTTGGAWAGGTSHTVNVTVTDAAGKQGSNGVAVSVTYSSCPTCVRPTPGP